MSEFALNRQQFGKRRSCGQPQPRVALRNICGISDSCSPPKVSEHPEVVEFKLVLGVSLVGYGDELLLPPEQAVQETSLRRNRRRFKIPMTKIWDDQFAGAIEDTGDQWDIGAPHLAQLITLGFALCKI